VLQTLLDLKVNVVGVVTRADKVSGRKQEIVYSDVKKLALKNNLKLLQPVKLKEEIQTILDLKPDLILTCSYGRIIPEAIINTPQFKAVNIHPSLLPKYRGASPIQSAVLNNDSETGVSFLYMTKDLDNGNILFQESFKISDKITTKDLRIKVKEVIVDMLKNKITLRDAFIYGDGKKITVFVNFSSEVKISNDDKEIWDSEKSIYLPDVGEYIDADENEFDEDIFFYEKPYSSNVEEIEVNTRKIFIGDITKNCQFDSMGDDLYSNEAINTINFELGIIHKEINEYSSKNFKTLEAA
ncbi:MAG: methionyl-tRNA formyltransferase, partial [Clostridia bacterium]|nr:methionyl-tRNA formyltransferase [Clostridia bacterium]